MSTCYKVLVYLFISCSFNVTGFSGAEDKHGYLWDKHHNVLNSVVFNPKDPEMLVTTSGDQLIKDGDLNQKLGLKLFGAGKQQESSLEKNMQVQTCGRT